MNTNRPSLLERNPFVDVIGSKNEGVFLGYPAPDGGVHPYQHHILSDWKIICKAYNLKTKEPDLVPELYIRNLPSVKNVIGVQVRHKRNYHSKRVWPHFEELAKCDWFEAIPEVKGERDLVKKICSYKMVICPEGGVSHIAAAMDVPAIVLMGGFTDPIWAGYSDHINLVSNIDCKHCFNLNPCKNNFKCWDEFSLEKIKGLSCSL